MRLALIQTGEVPVPLRPAFGAYAPMFMRMFAEAGVALDYETVRVAEGEPFPEPASLDAILITGSAAGVYDDHPWLDPLRSFIRAAYAAQTPMIGICFGHQIMADALGGVVRKSEKGWGLGRHRYTLGLRPPFLASDAQSFAIACSHQDQVIEAPGDADVLLASEFTPNAGLLYRSGAAISLQPHPEFDDAYTLALAELRRGKAPDAVVDRAVASLATPSQSREIARALGAFLLER